jgi:predicted homoserine dehydrogenase-like protein
MILVDKVLEKREAEGRPIRVGLVGAGFMGRGTALQIFTAYRKGIRLVAISNRNVEGAKRAYAEAGAADAYPVDSVQELEDNIRMRRVSVTEDAMHLCRAEGVDVVLEMTGAVDFGAGVALEAFRHRKHFLQMNAELDGTVGPILKTYADKAGVIYSFTDGDQPGVQMNLYRFVKGIGVTPVLSGSIKGFHDPYRNPTTQEGFAKKWGQKAYMVTSFADGTKISFEQAIVANATGMTIARRGMLGPSAPGALLKDVIELYPGEFLKAPGIVDYVVGAEPSPGVFIIGTHDDPRQKHYLNLYKLGEGPFYMFYTPYHLCHFEVPNSIGRAACFGDEVLAPLGGPTVEVVATAKTDLRKGSVIDGIGFYMTYGQCEKAEVVYRDRLLPMGVAGGCRLQRDVPKDAVLTYDDVELPAGRVVDRLRLEQDTHFFGR